MLLSNDFIRWSYILTLDKILATSSLSNFSLYNCSLVNVLRVFINQRRIIVPIKWLFCIFIRNAFNLCTACLSCTCLTVIRHIGLSPCNVLFKAIGRKYLAFIFCSFYC